MRHWLDPLIFFHQGNVANTVECSPWVGNLSCASVVAIFVSRPYLWESDRTGCLVAYSFCLNNLGRSKSRFYPFGQKQFQQGQIRQSAAVNCCKQITRAFATCPQHEKDYGTCGNGEIEKSGKERMYVILASGVSAYSPVRNALWAWPRKKVGFA